ncbi:uncharacterized protein LOC131681735 [Topomyia yanbarensis]|uniref:uncharacterized protein LOC131681735 n=1 Tax=Topomyia yanbarensis TaxID=2498891 RepID=UPI00273C3C54|nr:uncharacterized protein LOC131681735 [Topomyia yanbarensis]
MNFIASLIFLGLAASCLAAYTEKQQALLADVVGKCALELGVTLNSDLIERSKSSGNPFPDNEKSKSFVACFLTKTGALTADGKIQKQKFIDFLSEGHDANAVAEVVEKCAGVEGDTVEDKGYNFHKCFWAEKKFEL